MPRRTSVERTRSRAREWCGEWVAVRGVLHDSEVAAEADFPCGFLWVSDHSWADIGAILDSSPSSHMLCLIRAELKSLPLLSLENLPSLSLTSGLFSHEWGDYKSSTSLYSEADMCNAVRLSQLEQCHLQGLGHILLLLVQVAMPSLHWGCVASCPGHNV